MWRVGVLVGVLMGQAWASAPPKRVLFVGNSYTAFSGPDSLEASFERLIVERYGEDDTVRYTKHTVGGATLPMHLESAQTGALQPLLQEGWDIVVLQDQSQVPGFQKSNADWRASRDAAVELARLASAAGAETRLFLTWGREAGDPQNPDRYSDYTTMQDRLAAGYAAYAEAIRAEGLPVEIVEVGEVWRSVHDGVIESGKDPLEGDTLFSRLYLNDGSHPSPLGTYLAATAFFAALTGDSPVGLVWAHEGIRPEDREAVQQAATMLLPPEPVDTSPEGDSVDTSESDSAEEASSKGCGCQQPNVPRSGVALLFLGAVILMRRRLQVR